jgi:ArsR family transcriptional regulator
MHELTILYHALSDSTRLRILKLLEQGELCVCDLAAALDMSQPKISFHIAALKNAGVIDDRKDGRWMHYSIKTDCDLFRKFLIMTTLCKISPEDTMPDQTRLLNFMKQKKRHLCDRTMLAADKCTP